MNRDSKSELEKFKEFVIELKEESLDSLVNELEMKPKNFKVYKDRKKQDWLWRFPDSGDDIQLCKIWSRLLFQFTTMPRK